MVPRVKTPRPRRKVDSSGAWVVGRRPVEEVLKVGGVEKILVALGSDLAIEEIARTRGISVRRVSRAELDRLGGPHHQGVAAKLTEPPPVDLRSLLAEAFQVPNPVLVALDHLEDPRNVGAIARSAEAFGVRGLLLPKRRSVGFSPGTYKASAGALVHLPVTQVGNLAQALEAAKTHGAWVIAADPKSGHPIWEVDWTRALVLVIGGEGKGVSRLLRDRADTLVRIPTIGHIASLNASVAAGILLYEISRQRAAATSRQEV